MRDGTGFAHIIRGDNPMAESIFARGGSGMTRGGLDRYLGPEGLDSSSLPESIENPKEEGSREVDCAGDDAGSAVCEIAKAEKEHEAESPKK
jgi:hypothetical protein